MNVFVMNGNSVHRSFGMIISWNAIFAVLLNQEGLDDNFFYYNGT